MTASRGALRLADGLSLIAARLSEVGIVAMTMLLFPQGAEGLDLQRSSGLFRPPA